MVGILNKELGIFILCPINPVVKDVWEGFFLFLATQFLNWLLSAYIRQTSQRGGGGGGVWNNMLSMKSLVIWGIIRKGFLPDVHEMWIGKTKSDFRIWKEKRQWRSGVGRQRTCLSGRTETCQPRSASRGNSSPAEGQMWISFVRAAPWRQTTQKL